MSRDSVLDEAKRAVNGDPVARGLLTELELVKWYKLEQLYAAADAAVAARASSNTDNARSGNGASKSGQSRSRRLTATRLSDIEMRSIEWLDKPVWQRSAFHLLVGRKGVGKGTYLAMLMAKMTRGELYERPMNALVVSSEDSASIDTRPRVRAAGGDDKRIHIVNEHLQLPDHIEALRDLALEIGDVGMLVIDPIGNHTMRAKTGDDGEIRYAIAQLNGLADELRCLLAGVRHLGKNAEVDALARVLGSVAWVDAPRSVIGMARDDEDEMSFHLQVLAGNRGPSGQRTGRQWRMELVSLEGLSEPVTKAVELGESSKDIEDLLASKKRDGSKSAKARELILDTLDGVASMESDTLDALIARETGLKARTAKDLRVQLGHEGLIRSIPQKDDQNIVRGWHVARTSAPRLGDTPPSITQTYDSGVSGVPGNPQTPQSPEPYVRTGTDDDDIPF